MLRFCQYFVLDSLLLVQSQIGIFILTDSKHQFEGKRKSIFSYNFASFYFFEVRMAMALKMRTF